jgi:hypothetical protein
LNQSGFGLPIEAWEGSGGIGMRQPVRVIGSIAITTVLLIGCAPAGGPTAPTGGPTASTVHLGAGQSIRRCARR